MLKKLRTKHFLFLYISLFMGYCTAEISGRNFPAAYIISAFVYFCIISFIDRKFRPFTVEKREHSEGRELGGDIARTLAVMLVPVIHFFGQTYYYYTEFDKSLIFPTAVRWLSICAVPVFMIISGYFKSDAVISKKHYFNILPLIATHIFIATIRLLVDFYLLHKPVDMDYIIDKLVYFDYGWYIKLYIGMLLLMPFFNIAYKALATRRNKEIFILTLMFLTSLNVLTANVVPVSWVSIYVFGFYIIGCYLREYKICIKPYLVLAGIAFMTFMMSAATYVRCKGAFFDWNFMALQTNSGYSSPFAFITAALIMIFCLDIKSENVYIKKGFMAVSLVSLEVYLFSQMFDGFIYKDIIANNVPFAESFPRIFVLAGSSFLLAFIAAWAKKGVFFVVTKGISLLCKFLKAPREEGNA